MGVLVMQYIYIYIYVCICIASRGHPYMCVYVLHQKDTHRIVDTLITFVHLIYTYI